MLTCKLCGKQYHHSEDDAAIEGQEVLLTGGRETTLEWVCGPCLEQMDADSAT